MEPVWSRHFTPGSSSGFFYLVRLDNTRLWHGLTLTTRGPCLQAVNLPVLVPGARRSTIPLAPMVTDEDRLVVGNMTKVRARGFSRICAWGAEV